MSRIVNLTEGMRFGAGIDSLTEEVRGLPIEYDGVSDADGGQTVRPEIKLIESQESLMESMNLSISASVRYAGSFSADAKFSMAQSNSVNRYSLYLLLTADVHNPPRHMLRPRLSTEATRVYRNDPEQFRRIYGDVFIDEIYSGGYFYGLFVFETEDERSRMDIKADLDMSMGNFLTGGEISAEFGMAIEKMKKKAKMEIKALISGGAGLENPTDLDGLKRIYKNFNQSVLENPINYKASVKDFQYLPLPEGPTWAETELRRSTIEHCGRNIINGIRLRGDLEYILRYPEQFENPDIPAVQAAHEKINALLPKMAARARDCAQSIDRCTTEGLTPVQIDLPKRIVDAGNPLEIKWEHLRAHDHRAAPHFERGADARPFAEYDESERGGRRLFFGPSAAPTGGLFWHPDHGAFAVYGAILAAYLQLGDCEGRLGYPISDEETLTGRRGDGLDRISRFEYGLLWYDAQTGQVSETLPPPAFFQSVRAAPVMAVSSSVLSAVRSPLRKHD